MERKRSRKREAILDCLRQTDVHPSAEWVYRRLKPRIPDLSLATVYRNLALFKQEGLICSLGVVQGLERFDGDTSPHVHFICTGCGRILDLPGLQLPAELASQAVQITGGQVTGASLRFHGVCRHCATPSPAEAAG
ncbi:MAG TPA: transcriptional repressor [Candidatus Faecousia faecigallinarum]|nr:transcriptional repressor [Candidatus Faecousia faecigallinarum]